eukprot:99563-Pelagomonas_calceolata.AAC.2
MLDSSKISKNTNHYDMMQFGGGTCEAPTRGVPWKRVCVLCKYTPGHTRERLRPHTLAAE